MTTNISDYVASGYFLSRYAGGPDCTGLQLRRISMGHDHSQRRFFPETWTLSWCRETREQRIKEAAVFGLSEGQLDKVIEWADAGFGSVFGAWDVFYSLEEARGAARSLLGGAADLDLWGVGLHRSLVSTYCEETDPGPPQPWGVPGRGAVDTMTCLRPASLAEGGTVLGHEILIAAVGCSFNSPESLHVDERELLREAGVVPNEHGLIDSFTDALECCRLLGPEYEKEAERTRWRPWLLVRYPL
jgi:hypothetical protein